MRNADSACCFDSSNVSFGDNGSATAEAAAVEFESVVVVGLGLLLRAERGVCL